MTNKTCLLLTLSLSLCYSFKFYPIKIRYVADNSKLSFGDSVFSFSDGRGTINKSVLFSSTDLFSVPSPSEKEKSESPTDSLSSKSKMESKAAALRREALELEIAMREEAREKGLPQQVIDKLIPLSSTTATKPKVQVNTEAQSTAVITKSSLSAADIRSKLGYLNTGDAIRFTSELDRLKQRGTIKLWNSKDISKSSFSANSLQLTSKTGIEPISLRLDAVGYEYQKVLAFALAFATIFGLASSFIGGQIGFLLGYAAALFPVGLVGIGSIAPQLIGDVLNKFKYATDATEKAKYARGNAGKFLVGYILGLPLSEFNQGGDSNRVNFFQIKPSVAELKEKSNQAFSKKAFKQSDIAPISVICVSGPTAECMEYKIAGGSSPSDVNLLYELMNAIEPALSPDKVQSHIRWSVLTAHDILTAHKEELEKLTEAFASGTPLEECIAIIEGSIAAGSKSIEPSSSNDS